MKGAPARKGKIIHIWSLLNPQTHHADLPAELQVIQQKHQRGGGRVCSIVHGDGGHGLPQPLRVEVVRLLLIR